MRIWGETHVTKLTNRWSAATAAVATAGVLVLVGATPAIATGVPAVVTPSLVSATESAPGTSGWRSELRNAGAEVRIGGVAGLGSVAELAHPDASNVATLAYSWGIGTRPTQDGPVTIQTLLANAEYTYSGSNVNLQLGVHFRPSDAAAYGPGGTEQACSANGAEQRQDALNGCWAVIKFETGQTSAPGDWLTFRPMDFSGAGYVTNVTPGWWPTQNIGPYGSANRAGIDQLLEQMEGYEVWAMGVSVGSGTTGAGYVSDLAFGGATYSFLPDPAAPPVPTPADTSLLLELLADPAADVAVFDDSQLLGVSAADLTQVGADEDLAVSLGWDGGADGLVDAYVFSTPTPIGSFPVTQGRIDVTLSAAQLAALGGTDHHLVLIGQSSGAIRALPFALASSGGSGGGGGTVPGAAPGAELAPTGISEGTETLLAVAALALLSGAAALVLVRGRRPAR